MINIYCVASDIPSYATDGSAGADLKAKIENITSDKFLFNCFLKKEDKEIVMHPGGRCLIPTGLYISLPIGYEAQVRPRSGLALKKGITVLNTPGTIDAGVR